MSINIEMETKELKNLFFLSTLTVSKEKNNSLNNAIIEIKDNKLSITSKTPIIKSSQTIEIDSDNIEKIVINPNTIFNILKELSEDKTTIELDDKFLKIKNGNFKTKIKTINKNLYPIDEETGEKEKITSLDFNKLKHLIKSTIYCPDKNDISREFTGIFLEIEKNQLKATATDHFRLINVITNIENQEKTDKFLIENDGASLITKINFEETVDLYKTHNSLEIKKENKLIKSKLIKSKFPDYTEILYDENNNIIEINRKETLNAIKRVSVTNPDSKVELFINTNDNKLIITSINSEGEESTDSVEIIDKNSDNNIKINLYSKFIIDFLSQTEIKNIKVYYKNNEQPIMLKSQDDEYIYNYLMTPITTQ